VSQIRLLIDEDAQHRGLAPALRARAVDVITARERLAESIEQTFHDLCRDRASTGKP